jgi:hypothetical protein
LSHRLFAGENLPLPCQAPDSELAPQDVPLEKYGILESKAGFLLEF